MLCLLICKCYINLAFLDKIAIAQHFGFYLLKCCQEFLYISAGGMDFPCGSAGKESVCHTGDLGSTPGLGRLPGERNGYTLQYSCPENSMDCIVCGVPKNWSRLRDFHSGGREGC